MKSKNRFKVHKVGFISPPDWFDISPSEFKRIAPDNVIVMQTVMRLSNFYQNYEQFKMVIPELRECYNMLTKAGADIVVQFGYPFSLVHGWHDAQKIQKDIEGNTGSRFLMMGVEVVKAIKHLGCKSLAVAATYYTEKTVQLLRDFLVGADMMVLQVENWQSQGLAQDDDSDLFAGKGELDPMDWATPLEELKKVIRNVCKATPEADCILVSGGGMRVLDFAEELEKEIAKPIIGGDVSIYWGILRRLGVKENIHGYGSLLASLAHSNSQ